MDVYVVVIACPNTGHSTPTGVEIDTLAAFDYVGLMPQRASCSHCPDTHAWTKRDAWIERRTASRVRVRAALSAPPAAAAG